MYRNSTVGSLPLGLSRRLIAQCFCSLFACLLAVCGLALIGGVALDAQSTQGGGIQGTVLDPSGAAVVKATVTATNTDTGVQRSTVTGSGGTYTIQPLQAGPYNVEVVAKGFQRLLQENITVDNNAVLGLPLKLSVGGETTTVTVTEAPPTLDTTDATLGGVIENELYSSLPLSMNGGPRDPTAFQYLMPGVQENPDAATGQGANNGNSGIYGGTGQTNLNENYVEGVPVTNISQQGSSNPVSSAVSVDAVDQFSVQTSGASTSFAGAGSANYTIKSGGNQFHGTVFDIIRNTMFDTWGYFSKVANSTTGFAVKPGEHQNSYGGSMGGPILKDRLFFFASYEGYHFTNISNTPQYITIPTTAERTGDFTDVLGTTQDRIVDPTAGSFGSRPGFTGLLNGVPTHNVIQPSKISSITNYLQSALPKPTNLSTFSNYLANLPNANTDYSEDVKLDYTINQRNKLSLTSIGGNIGYGGQPFYTTPTQLPLPYSGGQFTNQKTATGILSYIYVASQSLINTLRYSFTRNWGQGFSLTANRSNPLMPAPQNPGTTCPKGNENACAAGINNLPPGLASAAMPVVIFEAGNGPTAPCNWATKNCTDTSSASNSTGPKATNTYFAVDELQWQRGRHNIKFGADMEWLETNGGSYAGFSSPLSLHFTGYSTEIDTSTDSHTNGDAYASFLVGAVNEWAGSTQAIQDTGGRFRQPALYVQDTWQASPKLTLNLGIRYDYLQPYREVQNRISFLNVNKINPITGTLGVLEFAGFPDPSKFPAIPANGTVPAETAAQVFAQYSPYICHCTTPVKPYNKSFQPRVGFAYAYTTKTVFSGAWGMNLTRAGGSGNVGAAGTGNSGEYSASYGQKQSGSTGDPEFFLNPGLSTAPNQVVKNQGTNPTPVNGVDGPTIPCVAAGTCSVLSAIPPYTIPGIQVNPLSTTGNYNYTTFFADHANDYGCGTSDNLHCSPGGVNFADPYYGGRGPEFINYNFQVQRVINKKAVLTVAYSGSQTHFLPKGAGRGPATNSISPDTGQQYKGALTAGFAGAAGPFPGFSGPQGTVAQSLRPFPQFGTLTDLWGDTGNSNYNSLQVTVTQRAWHNLQGFANYTRAKEIDDTGNHRTQYPIGPQDGNFTRTYKAGQVDRSLGTSNQTNAINVTWSYNFPIGRGQAFFATNRIAGLIGGGWQINGIYKYRDGVPLQITQSPACMANSADLQGTCMPDYAPGFDKRQARINGRYGRGPGASASTLNKIQYLNNAAFQCPDSSPTNNQYTCGGTTEPNTTFKIGNIARTAPDGLHGPGWWDVDLGIRRTFIVRETATLHLTFEFVGEVTNATNSTFFNLASTSWENAAYGTISGQNKQILPRDWQFTGRFRF